MITFDIIECIRDCNLIILFPVGIRNTQRTDRPMEDFTCRKKGNYINDSVIIRTWHSNLYACKRLAVSIKRRPIIEYIYITFSIKPSSLTPNTLSFLTLALTYN